MQVLSLTDDRMAMTFHNRIININGANYKSLTFIVRLLTYEELIRINAIAVDDTYLTLLIEDDIFNTVVESVVGLEGIEIDIDTIDAGIVSTIAGAVTSSSNFYLHNVEQGIKDEAANSTVYDQMQLVVAKNYNIDFAEVRKIPLDVLVRKFGLHQVTFPQDSLTFEQDQQSSKPDFE